MRRVVTALLLALALLVPAPSASADQVVVVPGTAFPGGNAFLSWFGCAGLFGGGGAGPRATVGLEPGGPMGARATRLSLPGAGQASGPVGRVASVSNATWSMWVKPDGGGQGAAHVWFVSRELREGEVWSGTAALSAPAGQWSQAVPAAATFTWTRYVAATGQVVARAGSATLDAFTAVHGDGPGYLLAGFGCDGAGFALDKISVGDPGAVSTYDLEGFPVTTSIQGSPAPVATGTPVTISGATVDGAQRHTSAPLVLESRPAGAGQFAPAATVQPPTRGADGQIRAVVAPDQATEYRWFRPETGYAVAGYSPVTTVRVGP